jgi:hypothetical protein
MSFSRLSLSLALGLSLNTSLASEPFETVSSVYDQKQPLVIALKIDERRRGIEKGCDAPDIWTMNLACQMKSFCYRAEEEVKFWLPKSERVGRMTLVLKTRRPRQKVNLPWSSKKDTLSWPVKQMPIESERQYQLQLKTMAEKKFDYFITLHKIPDEYETTTQQKQWMLEEEACKQQAIQFFPEENESLPEDSMG